MNVKGGIAYIDFKGVDIRTTDTFVIKNAFKVVEKAYKSKKLIVLSNIKMSDELLNDAITFGIRKRDDTHYALQFNVTNNTTGSRFARYAIVDSTDTVSISPV